MREILFRGKRLDNGEWVEGYYAAEPYTKNTYNCGYILENEKDLFAKKAWLVDSRTVGQYTGLTDKNGKKIFEGDILSIAQKGNGIGDYFYPPLKYPSNAIVKWDKCSWMWEIIAEQRYYLTFPDAWCHFECKIIGNIHDNPELLAMARDPDPPKREPEHKEPTILWTVGNLCMWKGKLCEIERFDTTSNNQTVVHLRREGLGYGLCVPIEELEEKE